MPKKGRIDELFDVVALATQRDRVIKEIIGTFVAEVEKANKIKFDLKGSTKPSDVIKNTEDLINSNKKLTVIIQEGAKAVSDKIAVDKQQIQTDNEGKQSIDAKVESQKVANAESEVTMQQTKEQVAAEDELLLSAIQNEIAMKKLAQAKRDLNAEFQKGNISEEDYAQGLLNIKKAEDALTASNANIIASLKSIQDGMKKTGDEGKKVVDSEEKMKKTGDQVIQTIYERIKAQQAQNSAVAITKEQIDNQIESEERLLRAAVNNELILKSYAAAKRELEKQFKLGNITEEQYVKTLIDLKKATGEVANEQKFVTTALKATQAQLSAAPGSIDKMAARLNLMRLTFKAMSDEQKKSDIGKEFERQTNQLATDLNEAKQRVGDFSSNVGRYAESLEGLFSSVREELRRLKAEGADLQTKFQNLTPQDQKGRPGFDISGQINQNIIAQQKLEKVNQIGFKSNQTFARTVAVLNKEYQNLATTSGISTEALQRFEKELVKARIESGDLREKIAAMSSETRSLDLLTGTIAGIADGFQVASGAAALFGADSEDVQKSLQKLIAIQSVANGVRSIANEITKDGSALNLIATGIQKFFADAFGLSTKKIVENTAAKQANIAVTEELAAAEAGAGTGAVASQGGSAIGEAAEANAAAELKDAAATEVNAKASEKAAVAELKDAAATEANAAASNKAAAAETKDTIATNLNAAANTKDTVSEVANTAAKNAGVGAQTKSTVATGANTVAQTANATATTVSSTATKGATASQKLMAAAFGTSTGAARALRIALVSLTGIGLIVGVIALVQAFKEFTKAADEARKKQQAFQDSLIEIGQAAAQSFAQDVTRLEVMRQKLTDLNVPQEERILLAREYNKVADEANDIDLQQIDNMNLVNAAIDRQIKKLKERAFARAAETVLAKKAEELFAIQAQISAIETTPGGDAKEQNRRQQLKQIDDQVNNIVKQKEKIAGIAKDSKANAVPLDVLLGLATQGDEATIKRLSATNERYKILLDKGTRDQLAEFDKRRQGYKQQITFTQTDLSVLKAEEQKLQAELNELTKFATAFIKPEDLIAPIDTQGATDKIESILENTLRLYFEHNQKLIQDKIDASAQIVNDDKATFEERTKALKDFYEDSKLLLRNQHIFELAAIARQEAAAKKKAFEDVPDVKKRGALIAAIEKDFAAQRVKANDDNAKREEASNKIVSEKVTIIRISALRKFITERDKLLKADEEKSKDQFEIDTAKIQLDYDILLQTEEEAFARRKQLADGNFREMQKIQEEHDRTVLRLTIERDRKLLLRAIKQAEDELEAQKKKALITPEGPETEDAYREITKQELKLSKLRHDLTKLNVDEKIKADQAIVDSSKRAKDQLIKDFEEISNVAREVFSVIGGFIRANSEREKNRIQAQIDALEERKLKEIEVINQTVVNEEKKAYAISVIEKTAAAQREVLEIKRRKAQESQARFEKAANIAAIIQETALAVIRALGDKTTPSIFGRIAGAAVIGAIGAAKLAVAIATPIPKYFTGTTYVERGKNPQGRDTVPALLNEGEAIIPTSTNKKYKPAVEAIHKETIPAEVLNSFVKNYVSSKSEEENDFKKANFSQSSDSLLKRIITTTMHNNIMNSVNAKPVVVVKDNNKDVVKGLKDVKKAIQNIPQPIIKGEGRWQMMMKKGHSFRDYLNDNL